MNQAGDARGTDTTAPTARTALPCPFEPRAPTRYIGRLGAPNLWRGHLITETDGVWTYSDTGGLVADDPDRECGYCGLENTPEGYDGCIGEVAGAMNACCGHGEPRAAYIQWRFER